MSTTQNFLSKAMACFDIDIEARRAQTLNFDKLSERYSSCSKRLLMFDYDGTLTPIVNDPSAALPTKALMSSLTRLASDNQNQVWIISGRSRVFLQDQFGHINSIGLSAEHGSFVRHPGPHTWWENLAASMDMEWKLEVDHLFMRLTEEVADSWIERKEVAMVWHYRNAIDHESCLAKAIESKALLEDGRLKRYDVEVMLGKANLEIRPRFLNKGAMAAALIDETFGGEQTGFVFCAGDDTTDEDMFRASLGSELRAENVFTCLVSKEEKPSLAHYRIPEPTELVDIITALSEL